VEDEKIIKPVLFVALKEGNNADLEASFAVCYFSLSFQLINEKY
jgi:hypothetical protein